MSMYARVPSTRDRRPGAHEGPSPELGDQCFGALGLDAVRCPTRSRRHGRSTRLVGRGPRTDDPGLRPFGQHRVGAGGDRGPMTPERCRRCADRSRAAPGHRSRRRRRRARSPPAGRHVPPVGWSSDRGLRRVCVCRRPGQGCEESSRSGKSTGVVEVAPGSSSRTRAGRVDPGGVRAGSAPVRAGS